MDWIATERPVPLEFTNLDDMWLVNGQEDDCYPFIVKCGTLGIPFWTVGPLYDTAWQIMIDKRNDIDLKIMNFASRVLVLLNGDHQTAWNCRRRLLTSIPYELNLCAISLSKHPKSDAAWAYRAWLMSQCISVDIIEESNIVAKLCDRHLRNYYAWSYKTWFSDKFFTIEDVKRELKVNEAWLRAHVSDFSAFHFRTHLLDRLMANTDPVSLLCHEWDMLYKLIMSYPDHESMWVYRRYLFGHSTNVDIDSEVRCCDEIGTVESHKYKAWLQKL